MEITLRGKYFVAEVKKRTQAKLFKNLKVGDVIEFSVPLKRAGCSDGRTYASYVVIENLKSSERISKSFNQIARCLECFKFVEYR